MKIRGFPNGFGSGFWRVIHPAKYLNRLGHSYNSSEGTYITKDELKGYDIYVPQGVVDLKALTMLLELKKDYGSKIILDFDDMLKVTDDNPHKKQHEVLEAVEILSSFSKFTDGITTTNTFLAERLRELNPNVYIVPNYMDLEVWQLPLPERSDKVRIGYVGSITHLLDVEFVAPVLKRILKKYPDKVELVLVGDLRWKEFFEDFSNVECLLGVPFENYPSRLNGIRMDIGICPLRDNEFNWCKSHIKWFENTIAGGTTVASPTVYSRVIKHGINGFLADSEEEWVKYLSLLIENKELRQTIHSRAYQEVTNDFSLGKHASEWEKVYETILKK